VNWSDDVHVFDSFSTDRTVEIAREAGATVTQRVFDGYASHRNAALHELPFKYPWVFILDADERIPERLHLEIGRAVSNQGNVIAYRIRRRDFLFGTWLKHAQITPLYIRLVRPEYVRYEREINEVLLPDGPVGLLSESFDHFPFSKGIAHWLDKHNRYSSMEAVRWWEEQKKSMKFHWGKAFFAKDPAERRFHQKGLFYKMPARPLIKLFYMLVVRRAFLDGRAGVTYAMLQSIYEYFIILKQREIEHSLQQ
jgi:glycosyltransferase involved in cell wall biosynthesis